MRHRQGTCGMGCSAVAAFVAVALSQTAHAWSIQSDAPGWTFTDAEAPVFKAWDCQKRQLSTNDTNQNGGAPGGRALPKTETSREIDAAWLIRDWRGREVRRGEVAPDGTISLDPLPPGYYRGEILETPPPEREVARSAPLDPPPSERGAVAERQGGVLRASPTASFTFCVVPENRCRNIGSTFAADSALSGCSRRGAYECPWHDGDCWHVTAELLGKCGIVHTRERLEWGNFIEPEKGKRDFSRYLASAKAMKENGVVSTGMFHDTPPWMRRSGRKLPGDLLELYRFMEDAARAFEPYYDAWEFWNEEEIGFTTEPCWEYVAALKAFALGARAGSETTTILPGALSSVEHFGYGQNMFDGEIAKYVQAFNIHTYENPCDYGQWHESLRRFLAEAGIAGWQVWLTESGTTLEGNGQRPGAQEGQMAHTAEQEMILAEFYPKSCILHRQAGICRSWYFLFGCYNDRGGSRDWGSMRRDGTVKPVHAAMAAVSSEFGDAELLGEKHLGEGLRGFVFLKPDGSRTLAFWNVSNLERESAPPIVADGEEERPLSLAVPDGAYRLVDMMGTPTKVIAENERIELVASRYPQYLSGLNDIEVDVPAMPVGRIARYVNRPDEDLTVVIRPEVNQEDFSITGRKCIAEMDKETGRIRVETWNLSPEAKRGRLTVSAGQLVGGADELELAPWGMAVVDASFVPPENEARFNLDIAGVFNGKRATRVRIPIVNVEKLLGECESIPMPKLNDPAEWKRNDSGCSFRCGYDEDEGAVRFDVEWNTSSSVWFFPVHEFGDGETFEGGRYLEFEVKSRQDAPENHMYLVEVMCLYKDKPRKSAPFKAPTSEWEKRRVLLPDDAVGMNGFRIGGLISGHKLSYWVRNFRLIKGK